MNFITLTVFEISDHVNFHLLRECCGISNGSLLAIIAVNVKWCLLCTRSGLHSMSLSGLNRPISPLDSDYLAFSTFCKFRTQILKPKISK
jgi:hypothetical protein